MTEDSEYLLAGEYFLAVQGLAMIRTCVRKPSVARPRVEEIQAIAAHFADPPNALSIPMTEYDVGEGYKRWASSYDGPNPAITLEEPIVRELLKEAPRGRALDAACGTGRLVLLLATMGYDVIGVDASEAMLDIARGKTPSADLRLGQLDDLPLPDAAIDLVTCCLALTHVADLAPVMTEFSRVLRPGGQVILSDMHPFATMTGAMAAFPGEDITRGIPFVENLTHHVSDYTDAFSAAGLSILRCIEPRVTDETITTFPSYGLYPDATRQAFLDTPYLLVWKLKLEH